MGYDTIGKVNGLFARTTSKPLVGAVVNAELPSSVTSAINNSTTQLVPGDAVVINIPSASGVVNNAEEGLNFNNLIIAGKATTTNTGAGTTMAGGFILQSPSDVAVAQGNVPLPQSGVTTQVARLGGGAQVWLEVAKNNLQGFQTANLSAQTSIAIDETNGGVKVAQAGGTDFLVGAKIRSGVTSAQKIAINAQGNAEIVECSAILVELM